MALCSDWLWELLFGVCLLLLALWVGGCFAAWLVMSGYGICGWMLCDGYYIVLPFQECTSALIFMNSFFDAGMGTLQPLSAFPVFFAGL